MRISDWSSDVCSSDLGDKSGIARSQSRSMARRVTPTFAPMQPLPSWRSTSGWAGEHPVYDPLAGQRRAPATDWPSADAADRAAAEGADHLLRQLSLSGQGLDAITSRGGQIREIGRAHV